MGQMPETKNCPHCGKEIMAVAKNVAIVGSG